MPFDPSLPAPHSPLESQVIREQLQALFLLIQQVPSVTGAQVDAVDTVPPGSAAGVTLHLADGVLHFSFQVPQGADGPPGAPGTIVSGAQVDGVSTLDPGQAATAGVSFDGATLHFSFGIPRGADGAPAPPPEVTLAMLEAVASGSSANSNSVPLLGLTVSDPPSQSETQSIANRLDELLTALRR